MTAVFEQHGLRIQYPENWTLQQNLTQDHSIEVQIASPSGGFWSLVAFHDHVDSAELMNDILSSMNEQYESAEWTPVSELLHGFEATGYDTYFYCLDLLIANRMRSLKNGQYNLMIMYQAENREFDQAEPVFNAITISMLAGLKEAGQEPKIEHEINSGS